MLQIFMFLSTSVVLSASVFVDTISQKFGILKVDLSTIFLSIVSLVLLMVVFEKIKLMLGLDSLTLDAKKQIRKEETLAKLRAKQAELKQLQQTKKDEKQRKTQEKKALQTYKKSQKFKSEVEKLRAREQAKVNFDNKKRAIDTRQNEIIKEVAKAELNHKINTRKGGEFMSQKYRDEMNSNLYAKYDGNSKEYKNNSSSANDSYPGTIHYQKNDTNYDDRNIQMHQRISDRYMLNSPITKNENGEVRQKNRDYKLGKNGNSKEYKYNSNSNDTLNKKINQSTARDYYTESISDYNQRMREHREQDDQRVIDTYEQAKDDIYHYKNLDTAYDTRRNLEYKYERIITYRDNAEFAKSMNAEKPWRG